MIKLDGQGIPVHKINGIIKKDDPLAKPPVYGWLLFTEFTSCEAEYDSEENRDVGMNELIAKVTTAWANRGGN